MSEVRIRVPEKAKAGDVITVRALVPHRQETLVFKDGKPVQRQYNFIHRVEATYNGKKVFEAETTQAVSENPLVAFPVKVTEPGTVRIVFHDTTGKTYVGEAQVRF